MGKWYRNDGSYQSEHPQISSGGEQTSLGDAVREKKQVVVVGEQRIEKLIKRAREQKNLPDSMAVVLWESDTFDVITILLSSFFIALLLASNVD